MPTQPRLLAPGPTRFFGWMKQFRQSGGVVAIIGKPRGRIAPDAGVMLRAMRA